MSDTGAPILDHDSEKAARKKRRRFAAISWLASSLMLVLALVATSPYWAPPLDSILPWASPSPGGNAQLGGRLDAVEQKLNDLASQAPVPPDLSGIESNLQTQAASVQALQETSQKLDQRLTALETRVSGMSNDPQRLLLVTLDQLAAAVGSSAPYGGQLGAAEALAAGKPDILAQLKSLDAGAANGIPGEAVLARQFSADVGPALLRAGAASSSTDQSWWQRILARIESLVVIRRTDQAGAQSADPVVAAVATAEAALDQGDLAGAVGAISGLPADSAAPAQAWLGLAQARLTAEGAVAQAIETASQGLAMPGAKSP
jgi:hypothetical protein